MRIVASVQAKRGSSRGLVHYIAHSKLDVEREPETGRELFNDFADSLSVESANNSLKIGIAKGRPSNDELHHLVLSFRTDDYHALGASEKHRRRAVKDVTRAAMKHLETALAADRLSWAAAVHLNTENPHLHIAMQKEYFTEDIERRVVSKIPKEALPHYETRDDEKVLAHGFLIEAATEKMQAIIDLERMHKKAPKRIAEREIIAGHSEGQANSKPDERSALRIVAEREALGKGIAAEYELSSIEKRIDSLFDDGDKMRFTVSDPVSGRKSRLSLQDIEHRSSWQETDRHTAPERQIKAILHKMLAKEETAKIRLQSETADAFREAKRIRSEYRKNGRKLPTPSLTKPQLDKLQQQCFDASDIRRFSYLESVRTELVRSGEIEPRSTDDLRSILAQKNISELRSRLYEKAHTQQSDKDYYLRFDLGDRSQSLADLDREKKEREHPLRVVFGKLKNAAERLSKKGSPSRESHESDDRRDEIVRKLDEQLASIRKGAKTEQNKANILKSILNADPEDRTIRPTYSPEQLAEIETLSVRLKLKTEYEKNWRDQRILIESARSESTAYRKLIKAAPTADLGEHKNRIIAGRALAREIVAMVEFDKAREDLKIFQDGQRFQKVAVRDKQKGGVAWLSLHDVDLPQRGSLLDRGVAELFEGREHRTLRRTVESLIKGREQRLKEEVTAAKEIALSAARNASEFKEPSFFGLRSTTTDQPIFTSAEIAMLELRAANTRNPKQAERLRTILESAIDRPVRSLTDLLRDFESPERLPSEIKQIVDSKEAPSQIPAVGADRVEHEPATEQSRICKTSERELQGHLR